MYPPDINTAPSNPVLTSTSDASSGNTEQQIEQTTLICAECKKEIACLAVKSSECEKVRRSSWLWDNPVGYACGHCRVSRCRECWQKHKVRFNLFAGWGRAICDQCQKPFHPGSVFVWPQKLDLLRETLQDLRKPRFSGCRSAAKWTARVLSLPLILFVSISFGGAVLSGDYGGKGEMIIFLSALFILLVAWRWELVGGGLLVMGISIMWCITHTREHTREEPWAAYILWMLGFLFLTSGSLKIAVNPAASQKAVKTARIVALIFAVLVLASLGGCFASGAAWKFNG